MDRGLGRQQGHAVCSLIWGRGVQTEIKATLSTTTWTVQAKISSIPSEEVIRDSVLLLEKKQQQQ